MNNQGVVWKESRVGQQVHDERQSFRISMLTWEDQTVVASMVQHGQQNLLPPLNHWHVHSSSWEGAHDATGSRRLSSHTITTIIALWYHGW